MDHKIAVSSKKLCFSNKILKYSELECLEYVEPELFAKFGFKDHFTRKEKLFLYSSQ